MNTTLDRKRIFIFLALAFGIAWAGALVIYLTGGLADSPFTFVILTVVYMGAPTIAHVATRVITHEGWDNLYLRPQLPREWPYWVTAWLAPGVLTIIGMIVFFALFPQYYDPELNAVQQTLEAQAALTGQPVPEVNPWMIVISQTLVAFILAPLINAFATFGEEFGWRVYLQPKLLPLGGRAAMLLMGVIWGVWHAPVIAMGHNYGTSYPGAPWGGVLMMIWFTLVLGTLLGWLTLRAGSVWPAVIGHGAINGIAALSVFFIKGTPNPLLGPTPVGVIGAVGFAVATLVLFVWRGAFEPPAVVAETREV
ncbi:MAG TPA: CPBP family intramembrane metalloprotease [Anaerolineae bacterium]|nr:CPBP family intramembrane metalloprotease [Anaerolineae bacterium]HQI83049.1 CPBP family intramembrane metalloprotease [Anaerolineae bacterium]